jgi:DNA adenine methylase
MNGRYKTPLRYPGGKQKLTAFLSEILVANNLIGGEYAEAYAGGAGIAIELLLANKVRKIHLNDASRAVYCFWYSILNYTEDFCRRIVSASITIEEWRRQKDILSRPQDFHALDLGYALFYLNRTNRSGIPTGGVIGGLDQTGNYKMDARFPRNELITRIEAIVSRKASIRLKNWDAERWITEYVPTLPSDSLVYLDPPYYHQSNRLYLNHYKPADHARISRVIQRDLVRKWVVSYDGVPEILALYRHRRSFIYKLQYNVQQVRKGDEVFIFDDDLILPSRSCIAGVDTGLRQTAA